MTKRSTTNSETGDQHRTEGGHTLGIYKRESCRKRPPRLLRERDPAERGLPASLGRRRDTWVYATLGMVGMYPSWYTPPCTSLGTPLRPPCSQHRCTARAGRSKLTALRGEVAERTVGDGLVTVGCVTDTRVCYRHPFHCLARKERSGGPVLRVVRVVDQGAHSGEPLSVTRFTVGFSPF